MKVNQGISICVFGKLFTLFVADRYVICLPVSELKGFLCNDIFNRKLKFSHQVGYYRHYKVVEDNDYLWMINDPVLPSSGVL